MSTRIRRHCFIGLFSSCLALTNAAQPVCAQTPIAASQRETARSLMDEGERLRAAGDLRTALVRFKAAHALVHTPTTGLQLARAHSGLGEYVEARGVALEASHHASAAGEPSVFAKARVDAGVLADELAVKIPSLQVQVEPADASFIVHLDGTALPEASRTLPFKTNPGDHEIIIEAPGFTAERRQVTLTDAQALVLHVQLAPAAADALAVAPRTAAMTLGGPAGSPAVDSGVEAKKTRGYIGLAAGGAVLVTGLMTGVVSAIKTSNVKDRCQDGRCPESTRDAMSSANTFGNVANITVPLGLIGLGYGLYELLTLPKAADAQRNASALQLDWDGTTASVRGAL